MFSATGPELAQVVEECAPQRRSYQGGSSDRGRQRAILAGFPALYEQLVAQQGLSR